MYERNSKAAKGKELIIKNYSCSFPNHHSTPQTAKQLTLENLQDNEVVAIEDSWW